MVGYWEKVAEEVVGDGVPGAGECRRGQLDASRMLSPSCVTWPAASHPGWSVCKLGSCTGTEARGGVRGETDSVRGLGRRLDSLMSSGLG